MKTVLLISTLLLCLLACARDEAHAAPASQGDATSHAKQGKPGATGLRHSYDTCLDASGGADAAMQDCIAIEYGYQDVRLNKVYKALMARLPKDDQTRLRAEERQWIAYRDAHCGLAPDGGQGQRLESNDCLVEETAKRATALEGRQR